MTGEVVHFSGSALVPGPAQGYPTRLARTGRRHVYDARKAVFEGLLLTGFCGLCGCGAPVVLSTIPPPQLNFDLKLRHALRKCSHLCCEVALADLNGIEGGF